MLYLVDQNINERLRMENSRKGLERERGGGDGEILCGK